MKFGINTFGSSHGYSGTGSYLHYFVSHIPLAGEDTFELFGSDMDRYTYTSDTSIPFRAVRIADSPSAERIWHRFRAMHFVASHGYDAVLYPALKCLPASFKTPGVAIANTMLPDNSDKDTQLICRRLSRASLIIASSRAVRRSLVVHGIDDSRIYVIHNGIDHTLFYQQPSISGGGSIKPFAIKRPYFIYTARLSDAHKHHKELLHAFELFKRRTHFTHRLVFAGECSGPYAALVQQEIAHSPYASEIFLTGFFPRDGLPMLYSCADALLFPSANEGVGMPILEAMATGTPVLCSRSGALPEMAGRTALLFNSDDIEEIAVCMERVTTDKSLRDKMVTEGLRWTKRFSWDETVAQTIAVLKSATQ